MPKLILRGLGAGLAALCLFALATLAPVEAAAALLKWAPPALVNPVTVTVQPGDFQYWCSNPETDVKLVWPTTKHSGYVTVANCHNVVSMGGWNTIPVTADLSNNAPSRCLYLTAITGTAHVEGLLCDASGGGMSDGIDVNSPLAAVQIENVRIDGIFGFYDQFHADCVQLFTGLKALRIDHMTCNTGYQGLSIGPATAAVKPWTADLENINISSIGAAIYGAHNSGGYIYWPCNDAACSNGAVTTLVDVFLTPRPGQPFAQAVYGTGVGQLAKAPFVGASAISFGAQSITGHVDLGPPPSGDFVPAGAAGPAYVSPGYAAP